MKQIFSNSQFQRYIEKGIWQVYIKKQVYLRKFKQREKLLMKADFDQSLATKKQKLSGFSKEIYTVVDIHGNK